MEKQGAFRKKNEEELLQPVKHTASNKMNQRNLGESFQL